MRTWLLGCALTLLGTPALADLQLQLQASGLDPQQTQATQALLDEAMGKLPPRFKQQLDRRVRVSWSDTLPADAYGQASLVSTLELNRRLLPSLTDAAPQPSVPIAHTAQCVKNCWPPCCMSSPISTTVPACGPLPRIR